MIPICHIRIIISRMPKRNFANGYAQNCVRPFMLFIDLTTPSSYIFVILSKMVDNENSIGYNQSISEKVRKIVVFDFCIRINALGA